MRRADAGIVRLVFSGFLDCPAGATANPGLVFLGFPALRGRGGLVFTGFPDVFQDFEFELRALFFLFFFSFFEVSEASLSAVSEFG